VAIASAGCGDPRRRRDWDLGGGSRGLGMEASAFEMELKARLASCGTGS